MATAKRVLRCHNCGAILQTDKKADPGFISRAIVENGVPKIPYCNNCYEKMLTLNTSNLQHETDKDIIKILNDVESFCLEELSQEEAPKIAIAAALSILISFKAFLLQGLPCFTNIFRCFLLVPVSRNKLSISS